jgi:large subunit ribosomal protein L23
MNSFLIKKPWITEKATSLAAVRQYVFLVDGAATKPEIRKTVESLYKVNVIAVDVVNLPAKRNRFRGVKHAAGQGRRKAIVTLKDGQKIDTSL